MRIKTWAALIALASTPSIAVAASNNVEPSDSQIIPKLWLTPMHVELAGADETDKATDKQLKDAGADMVPSEDLKQAKPGVSEPSLEKMSKTPEKLEPEKPEPVPAVAEPKKMEPMQAEPAKEMMHALEGPYLRLDLGYAFNGDPDGTQSAGNLSNESVDDVMLYGGGLGYRFNENLRSDLTLSYRPGADVSATTAASNTASTEVDTLTMMINGYWDITTSNGLTPYIGAGIGLARLSTSNQTTTGGIATEAGDDSTNFAWSLTAGAAYAFMESTALDMNYRYINLGEFNQAVSTSYDDLSVHEVRAGLRFNF